AEESAGEPMASAIYGANTPMSILLVVLSAFLVRRIIVPVGRAEAGVLLAPSAYFAADERHVRIGFGTSTFPASLAAFEAYLGSRRQ
nr:hypothetical protein [Chloroflexota bacterium]